MPFILKNKETGKLSIYGSVVAIWKNTNLTKNQLEYVFSKKKQTYFENDKIEITKTKIISSSRSER